jgi:hypothetical protein
MAITQDITELPSAPSRLDDPSTFNTKADAWVDQLEDFVSEVNTWADQCNDTQDEINATQTIPSSRYQTTSTTSIAIGTGSKTLTLADTQRAFSVGNTVHISDADDPANYHMYGTITAYTASGTSLTVNVTDTEGSGTKSNWVVGLQMQDGNADTLDGFDSTYYLQMSMFLGG